MVRFVRRHVIIGICPWNLCFDWQKIANRLNNRLGDISHLRPQLLHETEEQIPRASPNSDVIMVYQSDEVFKDLRYVLVM
jgi:hypothetical protein